MLCTSFLQLFVIFSRQRLTKNSMFHHANALEFSGVAKTKRCVAGRCFSEHVPWNSRADDTTTGLQGRNWSSAAGFAWFGGFRSAGPTETGFAPTSTVRTGEKVAGGRPRRFRMARLSGLAFVRRFSDRLAKAGTARTPVNGGPSGPKGRGVMAVGFRAGIFGS